MIKYTNLENNSIFSNKDYLTTLFTIIWNCDAFKILQSEPHLKTSLNIVKTQMDGDLNKAGEIREAVNKPEN